VEVSDADDLLPAAFPEPTGPLKPLSSQFANVPLDLGIVRVVGGVGEEACCLLVLSPASSSRAWATRGWTSG
jgi:hypothetical protein